MREILTAIVKTGGGSLATILLGLLTTKVIALGLGPSGIGLLSLLRQIRNTAQSATTLNSRTVIVQGVASREESQRHEFVLTVFILLSVTTFFVTIALSVFGSKITANIVSDDVPQFIPLIRWLTIPVLLGTLLIFLQNILNGYRAIGRLAIVTVVVPASTFLLSIPTIYLVTQDYPLAFIWMMSLSTLAGLIVALYYLVKGSWLPSLTNCIPLLTFQILRRNMIPFLQFAAVTFIIGLGSTWGILAVRATIVSQLGLEAAGIFDVAWTLSMIYIMLVLSSFSTYYLPTLSQAKDIPTRTLLIQRVIHFTTLIIVPLIVSVSTLRPLVVELLYSHEFLDAVKIIRWMLIGDYFKATSWVFGVTITAFADKKALLISELLWYGGFLGLSTFSLLKFGSLEGIGGAFMLLYLAHLLYTWSYVRKRHQFTIPLSYVIHWIMGLLIIVGSSFHTWQHKVVEWPVAASWIALSVIVSGLALSKAERNQLFSLLQSKQIWFKLKP